MPVCLCWGFGPSSKGGSSSVANAATHAFTSHLVLLQAPSPSGSGDYRVSASAQLCLPPSAQIYTSYLKTNLGHLFKTVQTNGRVAITSPPNAIRWSTCQQAGQVAVAFDAGVLGWDIRSMKPCYWLEAAHWPSVRDLDFNPHCPNLLVTGGDDGCVRLWDLRFLKSKLHPHDSTQIAPSTDRGLASTRTRQGWLSGLSTEVATEPLYSIQSHSHWVWSVRYHPTRDQLLLSSGSDSRVCLYNLSQFSSDVMLGDVPTTRSASRLDPIHNITDAADHTSVKTADSDVCSNRAENSVLRDGLIARLEQHEDSVYAVDWSPVDPWYFASVSYDGNLLINQVPEPVKMHILLQSKVDDEDATEP
ncbi:Protein TSSC1 [Fasciola gigantica]|uniref:Protein TSSC1 n=1 Tax=Fasciola gigantica TaxID=46835 RepID=A0A504YB16_FASGI|nr:Protein TSSC1 [Fasciola gigantica]